MASALPQYQPYVKPLLVSVGAAIVVYVVWVLATDVRAVSDSAVAVGLGGWVTILSLSLLNYALRFFRWQAYLRLHSWHIGTRRSLAYYLASFGFTTTPGKAGEVVRSFYLKRHGVPYVLSVSALLVERLVDLLAMVVLAAAGALAFPEYRWFVVLVLGAILVCVPLVHSARTHQALEAICQRLPSDRLRALGARVVQLLPTAAILLRPVPLLLGLALGIMSWGAEALAFHVILGQLGVELGLWVAVGVYSLGILVGALSFIPGGLGSTEAVMVLLLTLAGTDAPTALAATLICRLATLWFAVLIGWFFIAALRLADGSRGSDGTDGLEEEPTTLEG